MSDNETLVFTDYQGRAIRLTDERRTHILEHPEMIGQDKRIAETLAQPEQIIVTNVDPTVHVYHRLYHNTPVTSKFMLVAVKLLTNDAFVLTAFFSSRPKKGSVLWQI